MNWLALGITVLTFGVSACSPTPQSVQPTAQQTPSPKATQGDYTQKHTGWAP
jgi:hypothetical protein